MSRMLSITKVAILAGLALFFAGCATSDPESSGKAATAQDVPVPKMAEPVPGIQSSDSLFYTLNVENGWTFPLLTTWYEEEMPTGEDWEGWEWCRTESLKDEIDNLTRIYRRPPRLELSVSLFGEADGFGIRADELSVSEAVAEIPCDP